MAAKKTDRTFTLNVEQLNALRIHYGFSWAALAAAANIDEKTLRRWRNGAAAYLANIEQVSNVLKCAPQRLIQGYGFGRQPGLPKHSFSNFSTLIDSLEITLKHSLPTLYIHNVLVAINNASAYTLAYTSSVERGDPRNRLSEIDIADLWFKVVEALHDLQNVIRKAYVEKPSDGPALEYRCFKNPDDLERPFEVIEIVFQKFRYWVRVDMWSETDIEAAGIKLEPLVSRVRTLMDAIAKEHPQMM